MVGRDRVLVVEQNLNRVSERDLKGNIVWSKQFQGRRGQPFQCERLKNGRTFVGMRNGGLVELDRKGNEVASVQYNGYLMAAAKLRDGGYAVINNNGYTYVRLDKTGKEVKSFRVPIEPVGGSLYFTILPNGNVLVGQYSANKVYEVGAEGKRVWEATVNWPYTATRAANGNTLVSLMNNQKVVEIDKTGKQVREITQPNLRPYKASRR